MKSRLKRFVFAYNGVTTGQDLTDSRSRQQLIANAVAKARKAHLRLLWAMPQTILC